MTKRQIIILSTCVAIVFFIGYRLSTGKGEDIKVDQKKSEDSRYVKVQKIKNDTVDVIVEGFGRVTSSRNITLSSEVQGVLLPTGFNLKAGRSFTQGQLLFKVNDKEAQLALKARKSGFLNIVATLLPDIRIDFPDRSKNWTTFFNAIDLDNSLPDLPDFGSNKEKTFLAAKNILAEYYNIKGDEERIKKYGVYAPFNGTIVAVTSEVGTTVNPGSPIATIIKTMDLEVAVPINPEYASLVSVGDNVSLFSEDKSISWEGVVSHIAKNVNENTQSVDVYITINNTSNTLYNGMYLEVKINSDKIANAIEVPRRALLDNGMVYVVRDSLLFSVKPEIVKHNKGGIILRGLSDKELVVVEPIPGAVDSMKVSPLIN
ncbi:MAG: efflux RND transporter periplasmic adaptor subunit [Vicingaceae bacterium]|nr:efflux RND transporter periplasmic adaptor subunit [Vicingaceae bacterium]